jgi:large subunit ribosomal protein L15
MNLSDVLSKSKRRRGSKRRGRGRGTGLGKTAGRGHKGAAARSGFKHRYHYEGGQIPMIRHMPKRGFSNVRFAMKHDVINLTDLEKHFEEGETVRLEALAERGLIDPVHGRLKVLGGGDLKKKLSIVAYSASESAIRKIEAAGAKLELTGPPKKKKKPPPPRPAADAGKKKKKAKAGGEEAEGAEPAPEEAPKKGAGAGSVGQPEKKPREKKGGE